MEHINPGEDAELIYTPSWQSGPFVIRDSYGALEPLARRMGALNEFAGKTALAAPVQPRQPIHDMLGRIADILEVRQ